MGLISDLTWEAPKGVWTYIKSPEVQVLSSIVSTLILETNVLFVVCLVPIFCNFYVVISDSLVMMAMKHNAEVLSKVFKGKRVWCTSWRKGKYQIKFA